MAVLDLFEGDCLDVMAGMAENSVDAVACDPPYHLTSIVKRFGGDDAAPAKAGTDGLFQRSSKGFMNKTWDGGDIAFRPETWAAALRVLKPGGHLVAFSASRTYHHMAVAIEAAGFELRDSLIHLYAAGPAWAAFLDGLTADQTADLGRALASQDGPTLAWLYATGFPKSHSVTRHIDNLMGAEDSPEAQPWAGWGTALKPAFEPIVLARKPLAEGSVARQILATGTGGLNIDAARIPADDKLGGGPKDGQKKASDGWDRPWMHDPDAAEQSRARSDASIQKSEDLGRWPANVAYDGSAEARSVFPVDRGRTVARCFFSPKANKEDRAGSQHPTVKPQALMRWLVRMVTPEGATVLDPFAGSGSTGWAALAEGRNAILIERDPEYAAHIRARMEARFLDPAAPAPDVANDLLAWSDRDEG